MAEDVENAESQLGRKRQPLGRTVGGASGIEEAIRNDFGHCGQRRGRYGESGRSGAPGDGEAVPQLGNEVLQGWAVRQQQKKEDEWDKKPGMNRKAKKNSIGSPSSEKSK